MLRSLQSSQDAHDSHLRSLIGQRNQRADMPTRFSSNDDVQDTPSVYSRAFFSPQQPDNGDHYHARSPYASPVATSPSRLPYNTPRPPVGATSMLDLDDEPRSSFAPSEPYDDDETPYDDDDEDTDSTSRISYLGPKMRFHSRAPWEMEGGPLEEEEEPEEKPRHLTSGFGYGRSTQKRTSDSSSPRPSFMSRKSEESSRAHIPPKRSFETISSQVSHPRGALYALAQESLSATSLGRPSLPQKEQLRSKFSLGRLRSDSGAGTIPPSPQISTGPSRPHNRFHSPQAYNEQPAHSFESPQFTPPATPYPLPDSSLPATNVHPYANPDLVISYADPAPTTGRALSNFPLPHNDSSVTVTESSTADSLARSGRSTLASESSANSLTPAKPRAVSVHLKNISSPIAVMGPERTDIPPSGGAGIAGWADRSPMPAFSLISLEEARAQRMRSATTNDISGVSSASTTDSSFPPEVDPLRGSQSADPSPVSAITSRGRGRSISAGAKAKTALQTIVGQPKPERRESEPALFGQPPNGTAPPSAPKTLKHKKSGFMRLFKGQEKEKEKEKEDKDQPPPVPSLPDGHSYASPLQRSNPASHRVPVPSLSPSLFEATNTASFDTLKTESTSHIPESSQSPRRTTPYLSINTNYSAAVPRPSPSTSSSDRSALTRTMPPAAFERPWMDDAQPQSAPANVTQFPALKLRPVSTLFSAHFADHIVPGTSEPRSSAETSLDTPRSNSPNTFTTPITPGTGAHMRTSNEAPSFVNATEDPHNTLKPNSDQSRKALQRQVWELEGQVRDLKAELEALKVGNSDQYCQACGRGKKEGGHSPAHVSVLNRPRARTGNTSRFTNALP